MHHPPAMPDSTTTQDKGGRDDRKHRDSCQRLKPVQRAEQTMVHGFGFAMAAVRHGRIGNQCAESGKDKTHVVDLSVPPTSRCGGHVVFFALHQSQVNGDCRNATLEAESEFLAKKSRDEPGFKVWSEPFPAKTSRGEHSRRANGRRRCALEMMFICR